jgi:hypothetical protein
LFIFPTVPPVEPAWANAGASTSCDASTPSNPTTASILDNFPISVTKKSADGFVKLDGIRKRTSPAEPLMSDNCHFSREPPFLLPGLPYMRDFPPERADSFPRSELMT